MKSLSPIFALLNALVFVFSFVLRDPDLLIYSSLVICVFMVLDKLGKGIVLREVIALFNSFIYLFMPLMGYLFFTKANPLAAKFIRFMPVSKEEYFNLALPAISGFILMLCLPLNGRHSDEGKPVLDLIERVKARLSGNRRIGLWMIGLGIATSFLSSSLPISLLYISQLIYLSSFAGLMYLYFSGNSPINNVYMAIFIFFILMRSLSSGMFTIVAYMGMSVFSFLFLKRRLAMWKKLVYFTIGLFILLIIQSVKPDFRDKTLVIPGAENVITKFTYLVIRKFEAKDQILSSKFMWPIYYRANQGYYVALVQRHIPRVRKFDNGGKLGVVLVSAFVPRFLWPDKPKAGGYENMKYYAGFILRGYTMNVGPLGEAYGSFGRTGAIVYMLALGGFIRLAYRAVFLVAQSIPLVVLWLPIMFYEVSYSGENDTLQIVNSLVKSALFVFILYRAYPGLFKMNPRTE